ncbi:MAG: TMEM165/GDT1 family protein [Gammaproteobacteria bacterium]|nr:TMEM165/GDT1 family protein [Gammaproteobacteria bacterium]MBU1603413.1 TMEM165/GDT1 family protein [Gammaproteobacteria bacterium]MBU2432933.1 TMEM165/GDT1 family protein [Gammaproteobacteria bacterium]MBU2450176.1 TMEM165/GDT1 family protein [Gammaproteobacteria bacterium]
MTDIALVPGAWLSSAGATFLLIALAEIGDKSQLVCMTLAARHRGLPVVLGAVAAFAFLNLLAVLFGAAIAAWLPEWVVTAAVAALFGFFGISSLRFEEEEDDEDIAEKPGHGIFATTFLMIFLAEFGDKTQIAVAGLGSTADAMATWVGATLALACTSILGVVAGRRWLNRLPLHWIHRISGVFFLLLALFAVLRLLGII